MTTASLTLAPTRDPKVFLAPTGIPMSPPADWGCLLPGDAGLTRRVKALGPSWMVVEMRGRKKFSRGLWAPQANIEAAKVAVEAERALPSYGKRLEAARERRAEDERAYQTTFESEVLAFLRFAPCYAAIGNAMASAITLHATPVGSGTVARTRRIAVDERAERAVIAWMRHATTAYDHMKIARVKGERRAVRRELAMLSRALLDLHRRDVVHTASVCPLCNLQWKSAHT